MILNRRYSYTPTPLHLTKGNVEVAKALLQAGADPTVAAAGTLPFLFSMLGGFTVGVLHVEYKTMLIVIF